MIEQGTSTFHLPYKHDCVQAASFLSHPYNSLCSHLYNKATSLNRDEISSAESDSRRELAEEIQYRDHYILALAE